MAGGSRLKIKDAWTTLLTPDQLTAHNDTLRMANQRIAHRVADHEGAVVVAVLTPPPGPSEVAGVGQMLVHMIGPEVVVAERLASACEVLLGLFNTEAERLGGMIRTKLGEANIDELYAASSIPGQDSRWPRKTPRTPVSPTKMPVGSPRMSAASKLLNERNGTDHRPQTQPRDQYNAPW